MGLLLSVFAVCVSVMELLAFYHNIRRQPAAVHHQDGGLNGKIARGYMRDLNRERLRILAELGEEDNRPDLTTFITQQYNRTSSPAKIRNQSTERNNNIPLLQIRKASLEQSLYKEDIVHHITQNIPLVISHEDINSTTREQIFGNREGSPYPTVAPRNTLSSIDVSVSLQEVDDESADVDRRSNDPTPQKIDIILQESNFCPNKSVAQQNECSDNKNKVDEKVNLEDWFKMVDEEDCVPDFDTSVLQRIDGVGAKPRTPSEERKLKLKKKRNSKSLNQQGGGDVDVLDASTSESATQQPFWVNRN